MAPLSLIVPFLIVRWHQCHSYFNNTCKIFTQYLWIICTKIAKQLSSGQFYMGSSEAKENQSLLTLTGTAFCYNKRVRGWKFRQDKTGSTGNLEVENGRALYIGSLNRPLWCILKKLSLMTSWFDFDSPWKIMFWILSDAREERTLEIEMGL